MNRLTLIEGGGAGSTELPDELQQRFETMRRLPALNPLTREQLQARFDTALRHTCLAAAWVGDAYTWEGVAQSCRFLADTADALALAEAQPGGAA